MLFDSRISGALAGLALGTLAPAVATADPVVGAPVTIADPRPGATRVGITDPTTVGTPLGVLALAWTTPLAFVDAPAPRPVDLRVRRFSPAGDAIDTEWSAPALTSMTTGLGAPPSIFAEWDGTKVRLVLTGYTTVHQAAALDAQGALIQSPVDIPGTEALALHCGASGDCLVLDWLDDTVVAIDPNGVAGAPIAYATSGLPGSASIGSDGTSFLVVWRDSGNLRARRFDAAGAPIDATPKAVGPAGVQESSLAWTGTDYLVLLKQGSECFIHHLDATGSLLAPPAALVGPCASSPHFVRRGNDLAVVWTDHDASLENRALFVRVALDGTPIDAAPVVVPSPSGPDGWGLLDPDWDVSGAIVDGGLLFVARGLAPQRYFPFGNLTGSEGKYDAIGAVLKQQTDTFSVRITDGGTTLVPRWSGNAKATTPALTSTPAGFVAAWSADVADSAEIQLVTLALDGTTGATTSLDLGAGMAGQVALATAGDRILVASEVWAAGAGADPPTVVRAVVLENGAPVAPAIDALSGPPNGYLEKLRWPAVASDGDGFLIAAAGNSNSIDAVRVGADGALLDAQPISLQTLNPDDCCSALEAAPSVAWTGSGYLVVWARSSGSSTTHEVAASLIESDGTVTALTPFSQPLTMNFRPTVACRPGAECVVGWFQSDGAMAEQVYRIVSPKGSPAGPPHTRSAPFAMDPGRLLWDGQAYATTVALEPCSGLPPIEPYGLTWFDPYDAVDFGPTLPVGDHPGPGWLCTLDADATRMGAAAADAGHVAVARVVDGDVILRVVTSDYVMPDHEIGTGGAGGAGGGGAGAGGEGTGGAPAGPSSSSAGGAGTGSGSSDAADDPGAASDDSGGCGCRTTQERAPATGVLVAMWILALAARRRGRA